MRRILIPAVLVLAMVGLAGCSGSNTSSSSSGAASSSAQAPSAVQGKPSTQDSTGGKAEVGTGRQVITNGDVSITVERPVAAADRAAAIVEASGGRVDGRIEHAPVDGDRGSAQLTLRIPSTRLTAVLDQLERLGTLQSVSITKQDVTSESQDLDARITALQASVDRLLQLMAKATTTADLIAIESALSERQANLESLQAQKRSLVDQVDLSTIILTLGSPATAPKKVPDDFLSGLVAGWNALVGFFAGVIVVIGVLLPWLVLAALLGGLALLLVRRIRRRRTPAVGQHDHPDE
ncbi:DUF4349 domain-containing protein [Lacisediminihabitans profunda]|nr:DUF4349 domain-containing protein [Lacisediminihabitans profunda]